MLTVPGSAFQVVQRLCARPRWAAVTGSLLVHAALATVFIEGALGSGTIRSHQSELKGAQPFALTLIRAAPSASTQAPDPVSPPVPLRARRPGSNLLQGAIAPLAATRPEAQARLSREVASATSDGLAAKSGVALDAISTAGGAAEPDPAVAAYRRRLLGYIEQFKHYPEEVSGRPAAGDVQLAFELTRSGRVLDLRIEQSSGSRLLDEAAMETLRNADPLPSIPDALPDELSIELPVHFSQAAGL